MIFELKEEQLRVINKNQGLAEAISSIPGQDKNLKTLADAYIDLVSKIYEGKKDA